jgi:hypothetical protein
MPSAQQHLAVLSQVRDDRIEFMCRKSGVDRDTQVVKPELGFVSGGSHMDVRRFVALVRIEKAR